MIEMISAGLWTAVPLAAFLAAVIYLADATERSGAAERAAVTIARLARGRGWLAFALVAATAAGLGLAAVTSVIAVWAGAAPWWPACVAAVALAAVLHRRGRRVPVRVPGRIVLWVGAAAALVTPAAGLIGPSIASARSPGAL